MLFVEHPQRVCRYKVRVYINTHFTPKENSGEDEIQFSVGFLVCWLEVHCNTRSYLGGSKPLQYPSEHVLFASKIVHLGVFPVAFPKTSKGDIKGLLLGGLKKYNYINPTLKKGAKIYIYIYIRRPLPARGSAP